MLRCSQKRDHNTKISEIEKEVTDYNKYHATEEFNKLTSDILDAKITQKQVS